MMCGKRLGAWGLCAALVACITMAGCEKKYDKNEELPYAIQAGDFYSQVPYGDYIGMDAAPDVEQNRVFDITDYGAVGDGAALNTQAIQAAIDACAGTVDGIVLVPEGDFVSGTLYLHGLMTLYLAQGGVLRASHDPADFDTAFIRADGADYLTLTGPGKIAGEGEYFWHAPLEDSMTQAMEVSDVRAVRSESRKRIRFALDERPDNLVCLSECTNVTIHNIILENSMNWTLNLYNCDGVEVYDTVIDNNRHGANTDGIDITGTSNAEIYRVFISTNDDGIVIKSPEGANEIQNVHIHDCQVMTTANAFKIGTETYGNISGILVEDCRFFTDEIWPGSVSGISILAVDGAQIRDVTVRNITMEGVTAPIFIRLGLRDKYGDRDRTENGAIEGILIENVTASDAEFPSMITGVKKFLGKTLYVQDVILRDINVTYRESEENLRFADFVPENRTQYPEIWRFRDLPAYGLYARHVDGLTLENVQVTPRGANTREKLVFKDAVNTVVDTDSAI